MRISVMDEEKARDWERYSTFLVEAEGRFPVCEMKRVVKFYDALTYEEQARFDNEVAGRCEARLRMLYSRRSKRRPLIQSDVGMPDYDDAHSEGSGEYNDEDDEFLPEFEKALRISRVVRQAEIDFGCGSSDSAPPPSPPPPPPPPPPLLMVASHPRYSGMKDGESSECPADAERPDEVESVQKKEKPKKPKRKARART